MGGRVVGGWFVVGGWGGVGAAGVEGAAERCGYEGFLGMGMLGDGCEGAVEGGEGSLEEADGFHGGGWTWFCSNVVVLSFVIPVEGHASAF